MMSLNLESAKKINDYFKIIVSGYIRNIQQLLPYQQNTFYIIPDLIQIIILIFYYGEHFSIAGDKITIDQANPNKISYHRVRGSRSTAYGNIDITSDNAHNKYIWDFKCTNIDGGKKVTRGNVLIGIDASKKGNLNDLLSSSSKYYAFKSSWSRFGGYGWCTVSGNALEDIAQDDWDSDDGEFETGDQITMDGRAIWTSIKLK